MTLIASSPSFGTAFHHLVATYDGTTRSLYFDGVLVGSTTTGGLNAQNSNFAIGVTNNFSEYFTGVLDDVAVYNRALSATEVQALARGTPAGVAAASLSLTIASVNDQPNHGCCAGKRHRHRGQCHHRHASGGVGR